MSLENELTFCRLEKLEKNKLNTKLHLEFIQICLKENLLSKYTNNMYVYTYIYSINYIVESTFVWTKGSYKA